MQELSWQERELWMSAIFCFRKTTSKYSLRYKTTTGITRTRYYLGIEVISRPAATHRLPLAHARGTRRKEIMLTVSGDAVLPRSSQRNSDASVGRLSRPQAPLEAPDGLSSSGCTPVITAKRQNDGTGV